MKCSVALFPLGLIFALPGVHSRTPSTMKVLERMRHNLNGLPVVPPEIVKQISQIVRSKSSTVRPISISNVVAQLDSVHQRRTQANVFSPKLQTEHSVIVKPTIDIDKSNTGPPKDKMYGSELVVPGTKVAQSHVRTARTSNLGTKDPKKKVQKFIDTNDNEQKKSKEEGAEETVEQDPRQEDNDDQEEFYALLEKEEAEDEMTSMMEKDQAGWCNTNKQCCCKRRFYIPCTGPCHCEEGESGTSRASWCRRRNSGVTNRRPDICRGSLRCNIGHGPKEDSG